jgi:hypothetical protein
MFHAFKLLTILLTCFFSYTCICLQKDKVSFLNHFYELDTNKKNLHMVNNNPRGNILEKISIHPSEKVYNKTLQSKDYINSLHKYSRANSMVSNTLTYRGDSRFPWKVWKTGGFWPKKQSNKYSVILHQWNPNAGQAIISTFSQLGKGIIFATSFGLIQEMYIQKLEQFAIDQSEKTWERGSGYVYALWLPKGIDLHKLNKNVEKFTYAAIKQKQYSWEKEIAVLAGIPRKYILAVRKVEETDGEEKNIIKQSEYTNKLYLNKHLVHKKIQHIPEQQKILFDILTNLGEMEIEMSKTLIANLKEKYTSKN